MPVAIGKKINNDNFIIDLTSTPHILIAGATGQGKSVGLNAFLVSLLYKKHPSELKLVLIDPKKVELSLYAHIEKHFLAKLPGQEAIVTDTARAIQTLQALCFEMESRYDLLKEAGTRNINEYNKKFMKRMLKPQAGHQYLPFIVIAIDAFENLSPSGLPELRTMLEPLSKSGHTVGMHLIIAIQRPSVDIIDGSIKSNFLTRIAYKVFSEKDSRIILDTEGAEQLQGDGDLLIIHKGEIVRLQGASIGTSGIERVVECISSQRGYPQAFMLPEWANEKESMDFNLDDRDPLFEEAARLIVQNQMGSTSLLQRRLKLGYNRAGRLMGELEFAGIIGPNLGSKAREVLIKTEEELIEYLDSLA